MMKTW